MSIRLSDKTLGAVTSATTPSYDRAALSAGILHFGVGNFHRAHQAAYLDRLFDSGRDLDWAIVGAGVMPGDARMREVLQRQDYLSTLVEQSAEASSARVTGPMIDFLPVGDAVSIIDRLADPEIRIVSLTVTEGGYFVDPASGVFDADHPSIRAEAGDGQPGTVFGLIAEGLKRRHAASAAPFTVMSCDNLPHNGAVAKAAVAGVARLRTPSLADWIEGEVAFPSGMVDRITPATGDREREIVARAYGIADDWPVFCEDFIQWVLEDNFPAGRPALEQVGVQFTADVASFEAMKIRILNGGHAIIAYPAGLLGIEFAHEAMQHPLIRRFLAKVTRDEILPVVPPVPGVDLADYAALIESRFANPKIGDTVRRLCLDGSNRQPKFIVPTIRDRLAAGADVAGLALESALWCRYCYGEDEAGRRIEPNDPNWERLVSAARAAKEGPQAWLAMADIYGDLAQQAGFAAAFAQSLDALWTDGVETVLGRYLDRAA